MRQLLSWGLGAMVGIGTLFCGSLPNFLVPFFLLRASFQDFLHSPGLLSVLLFPLPSPGLRGPCRGLDAVVPVCQACSQSCPAQPWAPVEAFPLPAQGGLFSLLRAEAKLVFPPSSGIVPQKHTMQLLKYLGLAGQPHSGPLVHLRDSGLFQ